MIITIALLVIIWVAALVFAYALSVILATIKDFHIQDGKEEVPEGMEIESSPVTRFIAML